jgi:hypothetical protein
MQTLYQNGPPKLAALPNEPPSVFATCKVAEMSNKAHFDPDNSTVERARF